MECCICYQNNNILTTECNHKICLHCLPKLKKLECPYCRGSLNTIPKFIKDKILLNEQNNEQRNEPISLGGGGFGIYWDAPGTPYGDLSDNKKKLLDELKEINYNLWRNIKNDINNNNKGNFYNEYFLRDLIDEMKNNV
jgi:hypothetical protein